MYFPENYFDDGNTNPAIALYGKRFYSDQSPIELWYEFLLLATSEKKFDNNVITADVYIPELDILKDFSGHLEYTPKNRLNLKLFAFHSLTALQDRHQAHKDHFDCLKTKLRSNTHSKNQSNPDLNIMRLLQSFKAIGKTRGWWAQGLLPICPNFLATETIWRKSYGNKNPDSDWSTIINNLDTYFDVNKHRFLARGGEHLYLQLCLLLKQDKNDIYVWQNNQGFMFTKEECDPVKIRKRLQDALNSLMNNQLGSLNTLAHYINSDLYPDPTPEVELDLLGDRINASKPAYIPEESWKPALIFAWEVIRIAESNVDLIRKTDLFALACSMQVTRIILAKTSDFINRNNEEPIKLDGMPYRLIFCSKSAPNDDRARKLSMDNLQFLIKKTNQSLDSKNCEFGNKCKKSEYNVKYGSGLVKRMMKSHNLIYPKQGQGERFVIDDLLAQFMVLTVVRGKENQTNRMTFDRFKLEIAKHFGIAVDADEIVVATRWMGKEYATHIADTTDSWLINQLLRLGYLEELSDSCALVTNTMN